MLWASLITDLTTSVNAETRLQRAISALQTEFNCDAVVLLQQKSEGLYVRASVGLVADANGRCFKPERHPRLAAILAEREPIHFAPGSSLPDPYDGLLTNMSTEQLEVHDCLGISLYIDGSLWGALTLDAREAGSFSVNTIQQLRVMVLALEALLRVNELEYDYYRLRVSPTRAPRSYQGETTLIGSAANFKATLAEAELVASSDLTVLIQGETGTGKELIAQYIHEHSTRHHRDMVYVNCAALPESLAESELFGHMKGAFSGAIKQRPGRFEQAHGSTLFLDEVGELSLTVQAKLLRVLQSGELQRLGSDQAHKVNVRIVAATNRNLTEQVKSGEFRADLYHRLSVYPILLSPLRERGLDILELAGHFLEQNRVRIGLRAIRLAPDAEQALLQYNWPGNVRELEHVISRACIRLLAIANKGKTIATIESDMLGDLILSRTDVTGKQQPTENAQPSHMGLPLKEQLALAQRAAIQHALDANNGVWAAAAKALEIDPSNLHKLAKKSGLKH